MKILPHLLWLPLTLCACAAGLPGGNISDQPPAFSAEGSVRLTWIGTAGCFITDGETAFFIDPFVSRYGLLKVGLGRRRTSLPNGAGKPETGRMP